MAHALLTDSTYNLTEGFHVTLLYLNDITGDLFMRLLIFAIWIVVTMALYSSNRKLGGAGDVSMAVAVGSFATFIVTTLFRLIPEMVDIYTYSVVLIVSIVSALWFFLNKEN